MPRALGTPPHCGGTFPRTACARKWSTTQFRAQASQVGAAGREFTRRSRRRHRVRVSSPVSSTPGPADIPGAATGSPHLSPPGGVAIRAFVAFGSYSASPRQSVLARDGAARGATVVGSFAVRVDETIARIEALWADELLPALERFITIPNVSPSFDANWVEHGYMAAAVDLVAGWCRQRPIAGLTVEVHELPER